MSTTKEATKDSWAKSDAKRILEAELKKGTIPLDASDMAPDVVYLQHPEFATFQYEKFRDNLNKLRKKIKGKKTRSELDSLALQRDRKSHPKPEKNNRGEPRWEGSEAERLLKLDVDNGKHNAMTPRNLHKSRKEYQDYALDVFRKHIHQEVKTRKFIKQRKDRAEKKKNKKSNK
jgi:hypothetical protein